jgi:ABC-type transport system involved in cytochrome c biogenesis permease subunit
MKGPIRFVPYGVAAFGGLFLILAAIQRSDPPGEMRLQEFGRLPVVDRGRVKPLDTMARVTLMTISNRQTYRDEKDRSQPAIRWLLEVMTSEPRFFGRSGGAEKLKVFRIENEQVLGLLGLAERPGSFRYALSEFQDKLEKVEELATRADAKESTKRDLFDTKILLLAQQVQAFINIRTFKGPYMVPPGAPGEEWKNLPQAFADRQANLPVNPVAESFLNLLKAYAARDVEEFNRELETYRKLVETDVPDDISKAGFETFFNNYSPFYVCALVYVIVFMLACVGWLTLPQTMYRSAFWLAVVALVVHSGALLARMYLTGRPWVFVTNLYSSAVFIGWMSVIVGLILEQIYHNGLGVALAGAIGASTLVLAHHLGNDGDTLEMLQAVLDTNFWLATHVTSITIGYAATLVAGFLGIAYIGWGFFTPHMDAKGSKTLSQMIYGVICFAMLFSFVGTVLGGIWADQSWGRFWGWDPKENGALLIVLWNALILHARWGGMIKQRGLAVLAVVGNMVTGWSWFGTNQLGVGLHAYGFNNALALGLTIFWGLHIVILFFGCLPLSTWRSFAPQTVLPARRPTEAPR